MCFILFELPLHFRETRTLLLRCTKKLVYKQPRTKHSKVLETFRTVKKESRCNEQIAHWNRCHIEVTSIK